MRSEIELKRAALLRKSPKSKDEIIELKNLSKLFAKELRDEISVLTEELKKVGCKYIYPWDMVNTKDAYPEAIDILIKHLPQNYHHRNKEGIVRALTVKEAKGKANLALIEEYNKIPGDFESLRWAIGNAIYTIVKKDDLENIIPIVENKENGTSRHRFISALGKIKTERAEDILIKLLEEEEAKTLALKALERMKSKRLDKIS